MLVDFLESIKLSSLNILSLMGLAHARPTLIIATRKSLYLYMYVCMYVAIGRPRVYSACAYV